MNEREIVEAILTKFRELRLLQGLTLEGLAELAGVHRTTIGLLERGERSPTLLMALQLANALGIPLSTIVAEAEATQLVSHPVSESTIVQRVLHPHYFLNEPDLIALTGLTHHVLHKAILNCYTTLDIIDAQLRLRDVVPIAKLVELANLSSMVGNLIGSGIAEASDGLYQRNLPHHYPDLIPIQPPAVDLEIKIALETNSPKGHLPKPGTHLVIRYVLGDQDGIFHRGKENRGDTVWLWEAKVGYLTEADFSVSNTPGDSGKTAVVKTAVFRAMPTVFFAPDFNPYRK